MDRSELQKLKQELETRAQRELDAKLDEVNAYLMEQARARDRLDRVRDANEKELRKEFENMRKELLVCYGNNINEVKKVKVRLLCALKLSLI